MKGLLSDQNKFYKTLFIFLCAICLAFLIIDVYLFWENIQIERKIQLLLNTTRVLQ